MKIMIRKMYQIIDATGEDMRLLTMVACMFYCVKRFSDVACWKWENMKRTKEGWEIIQEKSKTDQLGKGLVVIVPNALGDKVGPSELLKWFYRKLGKPEVGFVFCKFQYSKHGNKPNFDKAVGYDTIRKAFKNKLDELGLPKLDVHSCRIGGATESSRLGVARDVIKKVGNWKSSAVDGYIRPEGSAEQIMKVLT